LEEEKKKRRNFVGGLAPRGGKLLAWGDLEGDRGKESSVKKGRRSKPSKRRGVRW